MGIKITKNLNLKKMVPNIGNRYKSNIGVAKIIKSEVVGSILRGISPVKGHNQFVKYSKGYAKFKGRSRPVDLLLTGKLLNSLKIRGIRKASISIAFTNEKAEYHDGGLGNNPERKMLPSKSGESFKQTILNNITRAINRIVKDEVIKQNR